MMVLSSDAVAEDDEDDGCVAMMTVMGTTLVIAIASGPPLALSQAASSLPLQMVAKTRAPHFRDCLQTLAYEKKMSTPYPTAKIFRDSC